MKQIYGSGAIQMLPCQGGIVFVAVQEEHDGKATIIYRMFSFEDSTVSAVTRSVFLLSKFGNIFEKFDKSPRDFLPCHTAVLPDHRVLVVERDGSAVLYNKSGEEKWSGKILHEGSSPNAIAVCNNSIWASFSTPDTLIKYSAGHHIKQELRIGGCSDMPKGLEGIWVDENGMLKVCAVAEKKIIEVDTENFTVIDYHAFTEPVRNYIKINSNEIVLTEKGIFRL